MNHADIIVQPPLQRIHFSRTPITLPLLPVARYREHDGFKPVGFWYSGNDEWLEWCRSEMPHWEGQHRYLVDVSKANVLMLDTAHKVKQFHRAYSDEKGPKSMSLTLIDWVKVEQDYDGVEIIPYQPSLRLDRDVFWYYGWDVASGCVWNLDKVTVTPAS